MSDRYLEREFKKWFTMPLNFPDDSLNDLIKETARLAFYQGHATPKPTLSDLFQNLLETFRKQP